MSLQTPFETTGERTSRTEGVAFLNSLAADSGRLAVYEVGTSQDGYPLHVVGIGITPPSLPTRPDVDSILAVFAQHANWEPASHEAGLAYVRDLAYTTDSTLTEHMAAHPFWAIPNWNVDKTLAGGGYPASSWYSNGTSPNADHLEVKYPETRAYYEALITPLRPGVVLDMHENESRALHDIDLGIRSAYTSDGRADATLGADTFSAGLNVITSLNGQSFDAGEYLINGQPSTSEVTIRATSLLRGSAGLLMESDSSTTRGATLTQRIAWMKAATDTLITEALTSNLAGAAAAARARSAVKALTDLTWVVDSAGTTVTAGGYRISDSSSNRSAFDRQGILWAADAGMLTVSLAQEAAYIAVALLDPSSPNSMAGTTRLATVPYVPEPEPTSGLLRTDGTPVAVYRTDGTPVTLT